MRYSQLFGKTIRQAPRDEVSVNAKLLIRGGFVSKELAGVYNFLPLGLRVLNKISKIVREEMDAAGGQELLLSALQNKENWQKTGRWEGFDALFKVKSQYQNEYALGPTHEEVLVPLAAQYIHSYRDLPLYLYQIQVKFRDEPRAKSGLLRGREFLMKDLYSFHSDEADMMATYEKMKKVYLKVYERCSLSAIETEAAGGTFSKFSHEFQVICDAGEDEIIYCPGGDFSANTEVSKVKEGKLCDLGHGPLKKVKSVEVGNIFPLKDKYSKALDLTFKDKKGRDQYVLMGCYGIGISRLMGTIVEVHHDDKGIIWPKSVAPYQVHLIVISEEKKVKREADEIYQKFQKAGIEVLYDDRDESAGEKFADADLIGVPVRLVISEKTPKGKVEYKVRGEEKSQLLTFPQIISKIS